MQEEPGDYVRETGRPCAWAFYHSQCKSLIPTLSFLSTLHPQTHLSYIITAY